MNKETILVIGNGFDLAHELPTKYEDFLMFIKCMNTLINEESSRNCDGELEAILNKLPDILSARIMNDINNYNGERNSHKIIDTWKELIIDNFWLDYFERISDKNGNWIDFEEEMQNVIKQMERYVKKYGNFLDIKFYGSCPFKYYIEKRGYNHCLDDSIKIIKEDLIRMRKALELYLDDYINKMEVERISDIENIKPTKVLSFNYTDTYERVYSRGDNNVQYDFIHQSETACPVSRICQRLHARRYLKH